MTTAMGIMPHSDVERALNLALGLDIPFWPQLPRVSFYEDMYAQASQHFPGIAVDLENERVRFDTAKFEEELTAYSEKMQEAETFALNAPYSVVYHRFLQRDLQAYPAVRGQIIGPVSFGFRVVDEDTRPIIYNDGVRALFYDFLQRKANLQYRQLREKNPKALVWLDEPGLGWVFSGLSGYGDAQAKEDYREFFAGMEGPKALHLCGSINLPYLVELGIELLSFDAYQMGVMPKAYAGAIARFVRDGGIMCWGIVPTDSESLGRETPETLAGRLVGYWEVVSQNAGIAPQEMAQRSLLAPARCSLKNIGQVGAMEEVSGPPTGKGQLDTIEERLVEKAFGYLKEVSQILRHKYDV
ncbi:MAG: hypothetical protein Q8O76_11985 [Chloroflexota bacterium]|nr:hypothetical protein [Chloroflexota bacterium]